LAGRFTVPGVAGIFSLVAGPMGHGCPLYFPTRLAGVANGALPL